MSLVSGNCTDAHKAQPDRTHTDDLFTILRRLSPDLSAENAQSFTYMAIGAWHTFYKKITVQNQGQSQQRVRSLEHVS